MKSDLEQLMRENDIDALWVTGALQNNPDMVYFTGVHHVSIADLIKLREKPPVLFLTTSMEREEGEKSCLETHILDKKWPLNQFLEDHQNDLAKALAARMKEVFIEIGFTQGRIAVSGHYQVNKTIALIDHLRPLLPDVEFISFMNNNLIDRAGMTKDNTEISRIHTMGSITTKVVEKTAQFLKARKINGTMLLEDNGHPLTIQSVKNHIRLWLAELGVDNPKETIFAIGRDAGIPHSAGAPDDIVEIGKAIVFDIFPCEAGGGYFYDFTRTWCLGFAPEPIKELHSQVLEAHHRIIHGLQAGTPFKDFQSFACQIFSDMGHATIQDNFNLEEGYIHSIGHGLGLKVLEKPLSGIESTVDDVLIPGVVFTVEPGLYYPSRDMGVRIEDTLCLNQDGKFEILADYPYDLVLPMNYL